MNYQTLISWNNLLLAFQRAAKGKRGQANVADFEHDLEPNLIQLQNELTDFSYCPQSYSSFYIHEPKRRLISAAPFRDRVAHHALCNLIEPLFEKSFIFDSYANRVGKGTHRAINRAQEFSRKYRYVLQCDIRQFFPSIDHTILHNELAGKIKDEHILWLCDQILASGVGVLSEEYEMIYFGGDDLFSALRARGLPIGNLTSQFWGNVYLNPFDHFVKSELHCRAYLRFVEDFLLFSNDKDQLWRWRKLLVRRLERLRLTIHPEAHPMPVTEGFCFLGFQIFPQKRRLKPRKGIYYQRKLTQMRNAYLRGDLRFDALTASVQGWVNHARYANTVGLRKSLLGNMILPPVKEPHHVLQS